MRCRSLIEGIEWMRRKRFAVSPSVLLRTEPIVLATHGAG